MTQIRDWKCLDGTYGEAFTRQRDNLIAVVSERIKDEKEALQEVNKWLRDEFSPAAAEKNLERKHRQARARINGVADLDFYSGNIEPYRKPKKPGNALRADRLEQAFVTLLKSNQADNPRRILGSRISPEERRRNAMRVIVVGGCIIDPDAKKWAGNKTPLACAPWWSNSSVSPPIRGREDVMERYGHNAILFMLEVCKVLGWEVGIDAGYQELILKSLRPITDKLKSPLQPPTPPPAPLSFPGKEIAELDRSRNLNAEHKKAVDISEAIKVMQDTAKPPGAKGDGLDSTDGLPSLPRGERLVLEVLADSDPMIMMSNREISDAMPDGNPFSERSVGPALNNLIELDLAERPQGERQGARLTTPGRRLAVKLPKIAD